MALPPDRTRPPGSVPASRTRPAGPASRRRRLLAGVLGTLVLTMSAAGCRRTLCPSIVFPVDIMVTLSPDWPATGSYLVTVGCPAGAECGFLHGPVSGPGNESVRAATLLRPERVAVQVAEVGSEQVLLDQHFAVPYRPLGPQSRCGGDATAHVVVPPG